MAAKNLNEEDMMLRLSNHVNGIILILDIVDVNSFPQGSKLQKVIARQLIALRARISNIPALGTGTNAATYAATNGCPNDATNAGPNARPGPAKEVPGPKHPAPKGPVRFASPVPEQLTLTEEGWLMLKNEREAEKFGVDSFDNFHCYVCKRWMHANNLLSHIRGKTHYKNSAEEQPEEEQEEEAPYYGGHYAEHYAEDNGRDYGGNYGEDYGTDYGGGEYNGYDTYYVDNLINEMEADCSNERRVELMWDVVYAIDRTLSNIESHGKRFYCRLCDRTLNGPLPVVDHVRGSAHHNAQ